MTKALIGFLLSCSLIGSRGDVQILSETSFAGVCDASAGAALPDDRFVAADDETNHIRVYSLSRGGPPLLDLSLNSFLQVERKEPEADIEGAARVGDVIYWIGSHARNQNGKVRPSRQRFFGTRVV